MNNIITIWKYKVGISRFEIYTPEGAKVLCVQVQESTPHIWMMVNTNRPLVQRWFRTYGTGERIPDDKSQLRYIGTFQVFQGVEVYHLFEEVDK